MGAVGVAVGLPGKVAGLAAALLLGIIDEEPVFPPRYARVKDVSMKTIAALVVSLLMNVLPPPAPKTD